MKTLLADCGAALISDPSNLFYFSGYENEDARILLLPDRKVYFCDRRVSEEAAEMLRGFELAVVERGGYTEAALCFLKEHKIKTVGIEEKTISHLQYALIAQKRLKPVPAQGKINALRAVKSEKETAAIQKAQAVTDAVFASVLKEIRPGMTEWALAATIDTAMAAAGASPAFKTIAAFGKNTSRPHAHPSENCLRENDVVTIDFGAKYDGYCSDMTRSFAIGKPPEGYAALYAAVLEAQETAIRKLKAGMRGKEGDALARDVLKEKGLAEFFVHSLGHSLGIDIHESPTMGPRSEEVIPAGAVLSVEPGVYLEGKYGVRIEDIVFFKNNAVDNLTKSPKQLIII